MSSEQSTKDFYVIVRQEYRVDYPVLGPFKDPAAADSMLDRAKRLAAGFYGNYKPAFLVDRFNTQSEGSFLVDGAGVPLGNLNRLLTHEETKDLTSAARESWKLIWAFDEDAVAATGATTYNEDLAAEFYVNSVEATRLHANKSDLVNWRAFNAYRPQETIIAGSVDWRRRVGGVEFEDVVRSQIRSVSQAAFEQLDSIRFLNNDHFTPEAADLIVQANNQFLVVSGRNAAGNAGLLKQLGLRKFQDSYRLRLDPSNPYQVDHITGSFEAEGLTVDIRASVRLALDKNAALTFPGPSLF